MPTGPRGKTATPKRITDAELEALRGTPEYEAHRRARFEADLYKSRDRVTTERGELETAAKEAGLELTPPVDEAAAYLRVLSRMGTEKRIRNTGSSGGGGFLSGTGRF